MSVTVERHAAPPPEALAIRRAVFVDEQGVPLADEIDGSDPGCTHWLLREAGRAVATLRTRRDGAALVIARVATLPEARRRGHAARLVRMALDRARADGAAEARLGAQLAVVPWYEALGFRAEGPAYDDAGIPHRTMRRPL